MEGSKMTTQKIRSNVYLDEELKSITKDIFKSYGLSFSDGINFLLKQVSDRKTLILNKDLDIEVVSPNDPDYALMEATKGEETISLDEFMKL